MKIAVLGTGMVGEAIATKMVALGHEVRMGAREPSNARAAAFCASQGGSASQGTFEEAARFGELSFLCTAGAAAEAVAESASRALEGKVVVDVTNPLDFSRGMPPSLFTSRDESLGEIVQRAAPKARVVKTLNTVNCQLMVDAARLEGEHAVFLSGDDAEAKRAVRAILTEGFGWRQVVDLGPLATARATESYLPLWLSLWGALDTADFNVSIVKRRG